MRVIKWYTAAIAICMITLLSLRCAEVNSANTSEVGNPKLSGHLVDGRNDTPAIGATVRVYQAYLNKKTTTKDNLANSVPVLDSTYTDDFGAYWFDSLDQGIYTIEARMVDGADTLTMRHPSVVFVTRKDLGFDTLQLPGSIKGCVVVTGGENPKNITCYIPGTSFIAITNDTGGFKITGIPAGKYPLSFSSAKFNDTTLYDLQVSPNHETNAGTIVLGLNRNKNEHDVWGVFDSVYDCKAIARIEVRISGDSVPIDSPRVYSLDWQPSRNRFSGYIYMPDKGYFWTVSIWVFDTLGHRIGACRMPMINRATGDIQVPSFSPLNCIPIITLSDTTVNYHDSIRLRPVISKLADDSIVRMEWKIGDTGTFTTVTTKDTVLAVSKHLGVFRCIFKVTDQYGNTASDTTEIKVGTKIGGLLTNDTVLREDSSPYLVTQDFIIQFGVNLTIEPGTVILIDSGINLVVQGQLVAEGTASKKIIIGGTSTDTLNGWGQITLHEQSALKLKYCEITGDTLHQLIDVSYNTAFIDSCTFKNTYISMSATSGRIQGCNFNRAMVSLYYGGEGWKIESNIFFNSALSIQENLAPINISSNHFDGNSGESGGINLCGKGVILNNVIENSSFGIAGARSSIIENNTVSNCTDAGITIFPNLGTSSATTPALCRHNRVIKCGFGPTSEETTDYWAGILCYDSISIIDSNIITNNNIGIICNGGNTITNNNIFDNSVYNFRTFVNRTGINDTGIIAAPNNWWGTTDTSQILMKIYDQNNDISVEKLFIDPIATDLIPGAGPR